MKALKISIIVLLGLTNTLIAQDNYLVLNLGAKVGYTRGASFGRMVEAYNKQNLDNEKALKNFGLSYGRSLSLDLWLGKILMSYYQHAITAHTKTKVNDYLSREFVLQQKSWGMDFGGGSMDGKVGFAPFLGIYFAISNLTTDLKYRDGYRSLGSESAYNGIYHGFSFSGSLGFKGYAMNGPVGFTYGIRWCPMWGSSEMDDWGSTSLKPLYESWSVAGGKELSANFQTISLDLGLAFKIGKSK